MTQMQVQPRDTPAERHDERVEVEVDDVLGDNASVLEDWVAYRPSWEVAFREGHEFGRPNNVECRLLFAAGEQTSTLTFRLDQLDAAEDTGSELLLRFEERDGIAKTARLGENGLDVELFHILTFT